MRFLSGGVGPRLRLSLVALLVVIIIVGLSGGPSVSATSTRSKGYWIAQALGDVNAYGDAPPLGGAFGRIIVDMAATPTGRGYWLAVSTGQIVSIGDARSFVTPTRRGGPVVAIGARPQGDGVWLLTTDGDLLSYGAAAVFAPLDRRLPFIDIAVTPSGGGIWALDIAGGVQVRGDAVSYGGAPSVRLAVAIAPTPSGNGYWVLGTAGTVVALGAAPTLGSAVTGVYVDMAVTHSGRGYWVLDVFGRVKVFGDAVHYGDLGSPSFGRVPAVAIAATPFVNLPPIANADAATLDEDTSVVVNVLANDSDPENDPLTVAIKVAPLHGAATVLADRSIRYTPAANFSGSDQLTYEIDDGLGGRASAFVLFTVRPVNDPPVAVDDAYTTDEDTPLVIGAPGVLANDVDVDGDTLSAVVVAGPSRGTLELAADGSFRYTPAPNVNGADSFRYKATDPSGVASEATVRIDVRAVPDAPIATDDAYETNEDVPLAVPAPGVLANDTDADGDALTAIVRDGPSHGTLTLAPNGSFTYTPTANFNGADSFRYEASDGTLRSGPTTVRITVHPVNDAPAAVDDEYATNEDEPLVVAAAAGVLANDTDVDGDALSAALVSGPSQGTLTLDPSGAFTYTPDPDSYGPDSFTYRATDPSGAGSTATVFITVESVPDAPVATNDTYTVANTATLNVAEPGVLANDTDADGDELTASRLTSPSVGTLTFNTDGSFTYAPQSGFVGTVTFTYRASDGTLTDDATVSISVTGGVAAGCCLDFGTRVPEIFDFESYNGFPATPGHIGREILGDVEVEILGPWWLE